MWREWFTFSKQDRRAIIQLSVMIIAVTLFLGIRPWWQKNALAPMSDADSVALSMMVVSDQEPVIRVTPHTFNPNMADSLELLSVGLSPYVVRNILRYRRAGGIFRRPDDLARIYGLHDTVFSQVKPYIDIPTGKDSGKIKATPSMKWPAKSPTIIPEDTTKRDHPYAEYMRAKITPGQFVDLNKADTAELMKIPGIGPVYAKMIVDYRDKLGGFHHVVQLRDIGPLPEGLGDWVHVSDTSVEKLQINKLSVTRLRSHPYLTYYQAKAIADFRKREGDIRSLQQLLFLKEFTESDIKRLSPYLSFE